jgi:hypothetical protein
MNSIQEFQSYKVKKTDWLLIGCSWAIMQAILFAYLGINSSEESVKYINLARSWIHGGGHFHWNQVFYSGYIGLHMLLNLAGLPPKFMYIIQLIFSGISLICYVKITSLFINSRSVVIFSGILFATCFFIQQWVNSLFTDSIFSNLIIISIYYLLTENKSTRNKVLCWSLLIILPLFRPVGFLFLVLACIYWLLFFEKINRLKWLACTVYLLLIGLMINMSLTNNPTFFYPNHNIEANIICGYPGDLLKYRQIPYDENKGMISYFTNNPGMTVRLFSFRFFKVFSMTREYFSPKHNAMLTGFSFLYFLLSVAGSVYLWAQNRKIWLFLIAGILIFSMPSVIFCVEWAGRFSLPVYCFILLLCPFGVLQLQRRSSRSL